MNGTINENSLNNKKDINLLLCMEQIVSQYTVGYYNSMDSTKEVLLSEYMYLYALTVFIIGEDDKSVKWRAVIETIIFEYISFASFPGFNYMYFKDLISQKGTYKELILEKWKCLGETLLGKYVRYLELNENNEICEAAKIYVSILLDEEKDINQEIYDKLYCYIHLKGLQKLLLKQKEYHLLKKLSMLNNRVRWAHKSSIYSISVSAHSFGVAFGAVAPLISNNRCNGEILYDIFFIALFHDIYEIFTGDIIYPVKAWFKSRDNYWTHYESEIFQNRMKTYLETGCGKKILRFLSRVEDIGKREEYYALIKFLDELNAYCEGMEYGLVDEKNECGCDGLIVEKYREVDNIYNVYIKNAISLIIVRNPEKYPVK